MKTDLEPTVVVTIGAGGGGVAAATPVVMNMDGRWRAGVETKFPLEDVNGLPPWLHALAERTSISVTAWRPIPFETPPRHGYIGVSVPITSHTASTLVAGGAVLLALVIVVASVYRAFAERGVHIISARVDVPIAPDEDDDTPLVIRAGPGEIIVEEYFDEHDSD